MHVNLLISQKKKAFIQYNSSLPMLVNDLLSKIYPIVKISFVYFLLSVKKEKNVDKQNANRAISTQNVDQFGDNLFVIVNQHTL